jgi:exodeoxyribonuclease V alpha subunit
MNDPRRVSPPWLSPLSAALAEALPRLYGQPPEPALVALMDALTRALEQGELTIDLRGPAPEGIAAEGWPDLQRRLLEITPLARDPHGPLVLEGSLLGWRRWQQGRRRVREALAARASRRHPPPATATARAGAAKARRGGGGLDPQQRRAIRTAMERDLLVLAGGPGTGKTSTVAYLLEAVADGGDQPRIHLAAPTGKAAARLRAATGGRWPCTTLHQLLECRGEGEFRRHRLRPLRLDWLVVDEMSMVDLALMEALLDALPEQARLVLVGDPAQLPPVAPGAPLQEILRSEARPGVAEAVVTLRTTHRNAGAIAAVAAALRDQMEAEPDSPAEPIALLRPLLAGLEPDANVKWREAEPGPLPAPVRERLQGRLDALAAAAGACMPGTDQGWPDLCGLRDQVLLLTPRYRGPWGVDAVHREVLGSTVADGLSQWPSGTPVLCTRNLYDLGLSNGDLGVLVGERNQERWLVFGQEQPIWIHPAQVREALSPALALTVHKAQGSEATTVIVLLPGPDPTDPRLVYTALTRARREAWLFTAAAEPRLEMDK